MIYAHIKADGKRIPIEVDKPLSLERLQNLVGGYIEFVPLTLTHDVLCVNEEGRIKGLPQNAVYPMLYGDVVVGRMLATANGDEFVGII